MKEPTREELIEKFEKLPKELKSAFLDIDTAELSLSIGKNFRLTTEQIGKLGSVVGRVVLGIVKASDFSKNIAELLNIDLSLAIKITESVNEKIFSPIRDSLKGFHNIDTEKDFEVDINAPKEVHIIQKAELLNHIEDKKEELPAIMQPPHIPTPFEAKTKEEVFRIAPETTEHKIETKPEEKKSTATYPGGVDPYREPI